MFWSIYCLLLATPASKRTYVTSISKNLIHKTTLFHIQHTHTPFVDIIVRHQLSRVVDVIFSISFAMMKRQRTKRRAPKPRPTSPGIPGDYFECNEEQLVQKLHALRRVSLDTPMFVPSLLGGLKGEDDASWNSAQDNPDHLFEDFEILNLSHDGKNRRDFMEKMDGEQISLHSDQPSDDDGDDTPERPLRRLMPSVSAKSWEGSEIVLDSNSFVVDPYLLENLQSDFESEAVHVVDDRKRLTNEERSSSSPRSITKMFQDESSEQSNYQQHRRDQRRARSESSQATSDTVSLSVSATSSRTKKSLSRDSPRSEASHVLSSIHRETIAEEEAEYEGSEDYSSKRKPSSSRRWSFSSSVDDGHQDEMDDQQDLGEGLKRSKSMASRDYPSLQTNQELFLKLAEEEDLHDFQHINNFSYEGNYLFTRILRERTRIQLKRDMLHSSDKDLYIEIHKHARESDAGTSKTRDRGVFFLI
jgi:hypothetical protein